MEPVRQCFGAFLDAKQKETDGEQGRSKTCRKPTNLNIDGLQGIDFFVLKSLLESNFPAIVGQPVINSVE